MMDIADDHAERPSKLVIFEGGSHWHLYKHEKMNPTLEEHFDTIEAALRH